MTKAEAAKYLGISHRTLERYVAAGKLRVSYKKGKTNDVAVYSDADVEKLKAKLRPRVKRGKSVPVHIKLTLSLEEAAGFSGLPVDFLQRAIAEKRLKAIDTGTPQIRRADLEAFVASL